MIFYAHILLLNRVEQDLRGNVVVRKKELTAKKRQSVLVVIMTAVTLFAILVVISSLYLAAIEQEKQDLASLVKSQVNLIEVMAEFDVSHSGKDHPEDAREATIQQLVNA